MRSPVFACAWGAMLFWIGFVALLAPMRGAAFEHPLSSYAAVRAPRRIFRVVLDPGHGGADPGATSSTGLQEKDITLDVARRTALSLARLGIHVMLTRADDSALELDERVDRANRFTANLFVSIHCNASLVSGHRGVETYVLDTDARGVVGRIAERENGGLDPRKDALAPLIARLSSKRHRAGSLVFANLLQRATVAALADGASSRVIDGGVHRAVLGVLVGMHMPGVLFETSYLSNRRDEQMLASAAMRQRFADAITNAVIAYREGY